MAGGVISIVRRDAATASHVRVQDSREVHHPRGCAMLI